MPKHTNNTEGLVSFLFNKKTFFLSAFVAAAAGIYWYLQRKQENNTPFPAKVTTIDGPSTTQGKAASDPTATFFIVEPAEETELSKPLTEENLQLHDLLATEKARKVTLKSSQEKSDSEASAHTEEDEADRLLDGLAAPQKADAVNAQGDALTTDFLRVPSNEALPTATLPKRRPAKSSATPSNPASEFEVIPTPREGAAVSSHASTCARFDVVQPSDIVDAASVKSGSHKKTTTPPPACAMFPPAPPASSSEIPPPKKPFSYLNPWTW